MIRSLFAGVSGLRNHQTFMDVIANNIANVNTVGFKRGRITFKESLSLLLKGAQSATGELGGKNPLQIGLGMTVGSIDQVFSQGNLESTGQVTDLAIQGEGFFVVKDGARKFYTRAGNFQLDAQGRLVSPSTGFILQGKSANSKGKIAEGTPVGDITLPFGQKTPAQATSSVGFAGNLDAGGISKGSLLTSDNLYAIETDGSSDVNNLYANGAADAAITGMTNNSSQVTISDGTTTKIYTYVEGTAELNEFNTLKDLLDNINTDFSSTLNAVMIAATGEIEFENTSSSSVTLTITSTNLNLDQALSAADATLAAAAKSTTDEFSHIAKDADLLINLRNDAGGSLALAATDIIRANGSIGGTAITEGTVTVTATMTYSDLAESLESIYRIKRADGVDVNDLDGSLVLHGDGGLVNELTLIDITAETSGGSARTEFNKILDDSAGNWFESVEATDYSQSASITVFDSKGESHVVSVKYIKDPVEANKWRWEATIEGLGPERLSGDTGEITFDSEGNLKTYTYDGGASSFRFLPENGANVVEIKFDPGTFGEINGLSQFDGSPNAIANVQDGYTVGELSHITIDSNGVISGVYTNGVAQDLARVVLATFNNPTGLVRVGDNLYDVSGNSGQAVVGDAGSTIQSTITSGALELSNVDLVEEFTKMIIAQRGFQANARVTTVSDRILEEVVRLKQ